jgi:DNA-binding LacI/PurR family transcriptional regulator
MASSANDYVQFRQIWQYKYVVLLLNLSYHSAMSTQATRPAPKYQQVYSALRQQIESGDWKPGERLPSEAELVRKFGVSRITIGRAVRNLQREGLVDRRAGSGTYVTSPRTESGLSFGVLIPDMGEAEIFAPICQGMMAAPAARQHALLWGSLNDPAESKEERAWALCRQYVERSVAGVFFAPLELMPGKDEINRRIAQAFDDAGIPIVLLDRTVEPYPARGDYDLVGIDNRRAGYLITEHLLRLGSRRIAFVAMPDAAATVDAREAGYREALYSWSLQHDRSMQQRLDPTVDREVHALMKGCRPDAIVCANDRTAAQLMQTLIALGYAVPDDVRIVGIDDLEYASLLPVPLTTLRQPTRAMGAAALSAMLDRLSGRDLPPRDILLRGDLVVRRSCGST